MFKIIAAGLVGGLGGWMLSRYFLDDWQKAKPVLSEDGLVFSSEEDLPNMQFKEVVWSKVAGKMIAITKPIPKAVSGLGQMLPINGSRQEHHFRPWALSETVEV